MNKLTLKEAREQNKLDQFVKEHEKDDPGDADKLSAALESAVKPTLPQKKKGKQKKS